MIVSVGVDAVEIERIRALLERSGERFERRIFTPSEAEYCRGRQRPAESFAARFAAKEAVMKCLGTGWTEGAAFREIEVVRGAGGEPSGVLPQVQNRRGERKQSWLPSVAARACGAGGPNQDPTAKPYGRGLRDPRTTRKPT